MPAHLQISARDFDYRKLHKQLSKQQQFVEFLEDLADEAVEHIRKDMDSNSTSSRKDVSQEEIVRSREYFKKYLKGKVIVGRKKAFVAINSQGVNSAAYEAAHGNLRKGLLEMAASQ